MLNENVRKEVVVVEVEVETTILHLSWNLGII